MKFKIDENLPVEIKHLLVEQGHEADTVPDENLTGSDDGVIYQACEDEQRVLVTLDLDFSDIRTYTPTESQGIIVLRPASQDKPAIVDLVSRMIPLLATEKITRRLWIVGAERVRIRE